ncbi:low molecular weight protein-tyrosine-phosphatase [Ichthyenterobacterium sp. W332]|uniref:protein-tyrosine-phosphatase n=1 Tax=Microcosmobacter mediterraneus TaxID=3075607 RepID=A0ABU2YKG8_9FLAO|nr:low molecular weight protein-tyrosine-phosphatase [Ichthyenterobacterium sp. W332]MDT0557518.1 low molecular weight protein-tyrosine-phosphatase [Ichthyenterobacterium sp. W332]
MTKILMVCLGNICRSPLAQGILETYLPKELFYVDSAGTAAYHIGKQPDYRSIATAKDHNIDISHQSARQFNAKDFDTFDYIYVMDSSNYNNISHLAKSDKDLKKVSLILDQNPNLQLKDVPDPYYGDRSDFNHVYNVLNSTCQIIAKKLKAS